jgi:hypothetical protein
VICVFLCVEVQLNITTTTKIIIILIIIINTLLGQVQSFVTVRMVRHKQTTNKQTPWSESASELYRPSDRRLSAKRLPTFVDKGCHVVSVTDPFGRTLGFLDRSRSFSIK